MQTTQIIGLAVEAGIVFIGIPLAWQGHRDWQRRCGIIADQAPRRSLLLRVLLARTYRLEKRRATSGRATSGRAKLRRRQAVLNRIVEEEIRRGRIANARHFAEVDRWKEITTAAQRQDVSTSPRVGSLGITTVVIRNS